MSRIPTISLHSIPAKAKSANAKSTGQHSDSDSGSGSGSDSDSDIAIDVRTAASKRSLKQAKERANERANQKKNSKQSQNQKKAGEKRQRAESGTGNAEDENADSDDSGSSDDEEFINIPFELADIHSSDFHLVKTLLADYVDDFEFPLSGLADLISQQFCIGTAIKAEGTEEPLGFITALNLHHYSRSADSKPVLTALRDYLSPKCVENSVRQQFLRDFASPSTGLIVNHRVINVPQTIIPHLHDALIKDIEWAQEQRVELKLDESIVKFERFILIARCFQPEFAAKLAPQHGGSSGSNKKAKKNSSNNNKNSNENSSSKFDLFFYRFEEELFYELADWKFQFEMNGNSKKKGKSKGNQKVDNEELPSSEADERRREIPQTAVVMGFSFAAAKKVRKMLMEMLEEEL